MGYLLATCEHREHWGPRVYRNTTSTAIRGNVLG